MMEAGRWHASEAAIAPTEVLHVFVRDGETIKPREVHGAAGSRSHATAVIYLAGDDLAL